MDYMFERMERLERRERRHFTFLVTLIALVIIMTNGKTTWENVKNNTFSQKAQEKAQTTTNGLNDATKALLEASGASPASVVLMTALATATPDDNGEVGAIDFPDSNLAVAKVNGEDGDVLVVVGCHGGDSIPALEARFRELTIGDGDLRQSKFSLRLSTAVDPDDEQSVAEFEDGKLEFHHSSIKVMVPNAVPVIIVDADGEVVFRGIMGDENSSLPTLPPDDEEDEAQEEHNFV